MLIYGKPVVESLREEQARRIKEAGSSPKLVIVQSGNNLASSTYIRMKKAYGESIGAVVDHIQTGSTTAELLPLIDRLNKDGSVNGIIVQLPLPDITITDEVVGSIALEKDVDGLTGKSEFYSATAMAVINLLDFYGIELKGTKVAMVGYGRLVGKPLTALLKERQAEVTVCDVKTPDTGAVTRASKVIVSATGRAGLIKPGMVTDGTFIVDVGTAEDKGSIVGDVDPELLENDTLKITPARGGIGPITVSMLFEQLLKAVKI
ncbi:MAG TPA: bifunctional 5,10-methylenetetrahydrofolate dehydrogenase/5,10-methenyltetrahydrofolate cyclohydrolase [Candidatus Saccharimonadia bacterium]